MKILLVGNHKKQFTHTTIYREKAIRELGHELIFFEARDYVIPGRIRQQIHFLHNWDFVRLNRELVRTVRREKPDLCLVIGDRLVLPSSDTISDIKNSGCQAALWTTDAPIYNSFDIIKNTVRDYDHIFCAGTEAIELLATDCNTALHWLPFGCDPDYHRPVSLSDNDRVKYKKDIVFVGSFYPNRWQILKQLDAWDVGIWGPFWDNAQKNNRNKIYIEDGRIDVAEWSKIYSAAKIVIVIHYHDDRVSCYQASPKIYEALACGCFVLVDRQKDVFSLFEDRKHLAGFDNVEDLKEKINYYLKNFTETQVIAKCGRKEVLTKHTYRDRIRSIVETVRS
jgi:spore maturation protein CgeB